MKFALFIIHVFGCTVVTHYIAIGTGTLLARLSRELPEDDYEEEDVSWSINRTFTLKIGAIVTSQSDFDQAQEYANLLNSIPVINEPLVRMELFFAKEFRNGNAIETVLHVCEDYINKTHVHAVLLSHDTRRDDPMIPVSLSYTLGFYHIPLISVSDRDSVFSDKNVHPTFLRTVPSVGIEADVVFAILRQFHWSNGILICSTDADGSHFRSRFLINMRTGEFTIKTIDISPHYARNEQQILTRTKLTEGRVFVVYGSSEETKMILSIAEKLDMFSKGYVWIVNDAVLKNENTSLPIGLLVPQLQRFGPRYAHANIKDALFTLRAGYFGLLRQLKGNVPNPPENCGTIHQKWIIGKSYYDDLCSISFTGATGSVTYDKSKGDRTSSVYSIINIVPKSMKASQLSLVGDWSQGRDVHLLDKVIIWPGEETEIPPGIQISKVLKAVTLETEPFVMHRKARYDGTCHNIVEGVAYSRPCLLPASPSLNRTENEVRCCYGYCVDLLRKLEERLNISMPLSLSVDGKFGQAVEVPIRPQLGDHQDKTTGQSPMPVPKEPQTKIVWDGMIGEVNDQKVDIIIAALTIDNERAQVIDFTNPFKHQGLNILVKKKMSNSSLASFIQPFQYQLWILIALSVHVVALILYLLDRFSPFGRFRVRFKAAKKPIKVTHNQSPVDDTALTLASAMWFAWGVLLNSGIGEGSPRSFSARVLGMVWAGFAMIIVASYTANLAAFLVLDRPESEIAGINDARMRNPSNAYKYGTVLNSSVENYFKRKVEMAMMYRFMKTHSRRTSNEAIEAVRQGELNAFIWDSAVLDYETSRDCSLVTVGEMFHRSGYGIGMRKGSSWKDTISLEILQYHEDGFLETLDNRWMQYRMCETSESQPATLGLDNMAGVFMLVVGGIASGIILIFMELAYKSRRNKRQREQVVAKMAVDRWRAKVVKKNPSKGIMLTTPHPMTLSDQTFINPTAASTMNNRTLLSQSEPPTVVSSSNGKTMATPSIISSASLSSFSGGKCEGGSQKGLTTIQADCEKSQADSSESPQPRWSGDSPALLRNQMMLPLHQLEDEEIPKSTIQNSKHFDESREPFLLEEDLLVPGATCSDLKLFDPKYVREKSSAGRAALAKSSRSDLRSLP